MRLKFGIHKDKELSEIQDTSYLHAILTSNKKTIQRLKNPNQREELLGFGQHAICAIKDLPEEYRDWLLESSQETAEEIERELDRRHPLKLEQRAQQAEIEKINRLLADACNRKQALEAALETAETKLRAAEKKMRMSEKRAQEAERRVRELEAEKITRKPVSISHDSMYSIVASGFRQLAHKNHPDHGGDTDAMRKLIDGRDALMDAILAMGERKTA